MADDDAAICCCGPAHSEEDRDKHQVLRVNRGCTDVPALLVFLALVGFMLGIWGYAINKGQYKLLVKGMDWRGKTCGEGDLTNYPHQAWSNPLMSDINTGAICVKSCWMPPFSNLSNTDAQVSAHVLTCICNKKRWPARFQSPGGSAALISRCADKTNAAKGYFTQAVDSGSPLIQEATVAAGSTDVNLPCAFQYRTKYALHKCIPWASSSSLAQVVKQSSKTPTSLDRISSYLGTSSATLNDYMKDASSSSVVIIMGVVMAVVLSLVCMLLLRFCIKGLAYGILVALFLMFIAFTVGNWMEYTTYQARADITPQTASYASDQKSANIFLACAITSGVSAALYACVCVYMYDDIQEAVSIIEIASEAFSDVPQLMLYPLVHTVAFVTLAASWILGAVLLYSAGDLTVGSNGVAHLKHNDQMRAAGGAYVFGLIWCTAFLNAVGYMIVAGTVLLYFFAPTKPVVGTGESHRELPHSPMRTSGCLVLRYHTGTAALGSLVLSIVWIVRIIFKYMSKLGNHSENQFVQFCTCCFRGFLYCFETFLQFMNKMAYIQTMLHGGAFCHSALKGLKTIVEHVGIVGATGYISSFVILAIKLTITFATASLAFAWIHSDKFGVKASELNNTWVPIIIVALCAYAIASAFMIVSEVSIDAILVGYCEAISPDAAYDDEHIPLELKEKFAKELGTTKERQPLSGQQGKNIQ